MYFGLYSKNVLLFGQLQKIYRLEKIFLLCNNISYIFIKEIILTVKLGIYLL